MVRIPKIVVIQERDQVAGRLCHAMIAGQGLTAVRLFDQPDRVGLRHAAHDVGAVIGGAIVHDDDLISRQGLVQRAFKRLFDERRAIIERNDGRNRQCPTSRIGIGLRGNPGLGQ